MWRQKTLTNVFAFVGWRNDYERRHRGPGTAKRRDALAARLALEALETRDTPTAGFSALATRSRIQERGSAP